MRMPCILRRRGKDKTKAERAETAGGLAELIRGARTNCRGSVDRLPASSAGIGESRSTVTSRPRPIGSIEALYVSRTSGYAIGLNPVRW